MFYYLFNEYVYPLPQELEASNLYMQLCSYVLVHVEGYMHVPHFVDYVLNVIFFHLRDES